MPQPIVEALAGGWTVLTGNQRAAHTLRHIFHLRQRALGFSHWQPPNILAWDSWIAALWHLLLVEGNSPDLLLNRTQEHSLWRDIIAADPGVSGLRSLASLADLAMSAWSRLHSYRAARMLHGGANTTDTRAFVRWATEFERRCLQSRFLTLAQLPERLAAEVNSGKSPPPAGLLLVGFDFVPPSSRALLDAIQARNASVCDPAALNEANSSHPAERGSPLLVATQDPQQELATCARWLRDRLNDRPNTRIALIVPDIETDRASIDRALRNVLAPELLAIDAPTSSAPFEFSLGVPLDRTPIVAAALDLLRWSQGPLPLDRLSTLLLSPYFAAGGQTKDRPSHDEAFARAELDAFVVRKRRRIEPRITPGGMLELIARAHDPAALGVLRSHLRAFIEAIRRTDGTRQRAHADWAEAFQYLLTAAGWAAPTTLDSVGFQARRKWDSALDELASLDFDSRRPRVAWRDALGAAERIAAQTLFAPESQHAPIQIMGPLEAAGSNFDAIWFLRANDLTWPPVQTPHPLLPYSIQHSFGMPGTDGATDIARARRTTARIVASAPSVIFSYARNTADGGQRASPMLLEFNCEIAAGPALAPEEPAPVPIGLDTMLDDAPIPPVPASASRGGAAVLEAQAACSFRAFAERRLFSVALETGELGLDARDRGSIIHSVLHAFWAEVGSQAALRSMKSSQRDALLTSLIDSSLTSHGSHRATQWGGAYLEAERERLLRLLRPWLEFEAAARPPFLVKATEEELKGVAIGPLHLDIRVDRVDQTIPGPESSEAPAEIIIDYKTGLAEPREWEGPRPASPQLPLYAVVSPATCLAAVAFASIRPGKFMSLAGYQSHQGILPDAGKGCIRDLEVQRVQWQQVLEQLANDFYTGRALADPKQYPETCRYCRQRLLCRLELPDAIATAQADGEVLDGSEAFSGIATEDQQA